MLLTLTCLLTILLDRMGKIVQFQHFIIKMFKSYYTLGHEEEPRKKISWAARATLYEKVLTGVVLLLAVLIIVCIAHSVLTQEIPVCKTKNCIETASTLLKYVNKNVNPCENFYKFSCDTFLKQSSEEGLLSRFALINKKSYRRWKYFLEDSNLESDFFKNVKKYFRLCMNESAIEEDNNASFLRLLHKLGDWPLLNGTRKTMPMFDWQHQMVKARKLGIEWGWFLNFGVSINEGVYLLEVSAPKTANLIKNQTDFCNMVLNVRDILKNNINGSRSDLDETSCKDLAKFENNLYKFVNKTYLNEYMFTEYFLSTLVTDYPTVKWISILNELTNVNFSKQNTLIFQFSDEFREYLNFIDTTPNSVKANYINWKIIEKSAPFLTRNIRENIMKYHQTIKKEENFDRFSYCNKHISERFHNAITGSYIRNLINKDKKKRVESFVDNLQGTLITSLEKNNLISSEIKEDIINNLKSIEIIIGGPDEMYDEIEFNKRFDIDMFNFNFNNIIDLESELYLKQINRLFRKVFTSEDIKQIDSIELYEYSRSMIFPKMLTMNDNSKTLFIPGDIIHETFQDENGPNYSNYGGLGYLITKELFKGITEDEPAIQAEIIDKYKCYNKDCLFLRSILSKFNIYDSVQTNIKKINCSSNESLLEYISSHVGVEMAYKAYQKWVKENGRGFRLPGLETYTQNQLFWLINASFMCRKSSQEFNQDERNEDVMIPFTLVQYIRNSQTFKKDFRCVEGAGMNQRNKCNFF